MGALKISRIETGTDSGRFRRPSRSFSFLFFSFFSFSEAHSHCGKKENKFSNACTEQLGAEKLDEKSKNRPNRWERWGWGEEGRSVFCLLHRHLGLRDARPQIARDAGSRGFRQPLARPGHPARPGAGGVTSAVHAGRTKGRAGGRFEGRTGGDGWLSGLARLVACAPVTRARGASGGRAGRATSRWSWRVAAQWAL